MSGIGGFVVRKPSDGSGELEKLAKALEYRGPDAQLLYEADTVSLCHTLLYISSASAQSGIHDPASGLAIVCDARIDNRDELIQNLGLSGPSAQTTDADVVLAAYMRWGDDTPKHLLGDYAFVIHDPKRDRLFGARDPIGMRPLYYCLKDELGAFAFASDADALSSLRFVGRKLNEERVADVLSNLEGADFHSTFYQEVHRLPPAHSFACEGGRLHFRQFWQPQAQPILHLPSNDAYVDAFLEVFTEAVRCRVEAAGPVASMLSGGMDSNAVAAVADDILKADGRRLVTISAAGPNASECIETAMIHRALGAKDYDAHLVIHTDLGEILTELRDLTENTLEPFDATSIHNRAVYLTAHRLGIRVVLDGAAGDIMMHPGNRVSSLLAKGQFLKAWRERRAEREFWGEDWSLLSSFSASLWATFVPLPLRRLKRDLSGLLRGKRTHAEFGQLRQQVVHRTNLASRRRSYFRYLETKHAFGPEYLAKVLSHPNLVVARERYQRIASQMQIECRDPFTDLRVIEFCLSLPPEQFQDKGWPKILLRRTLERFIPREVVWRQGKTHLGSTFLKAYRKECGKEWTGEVPEALSTYLVSAGDGSQKDPDFVAEELEALARWLSDRGYAGQSVRKRRANPD